jgi:thioredoxin 1
MRGIIEVEDARSFEMLQRWPVPQVVEFWAPWCGPCRAMGPVFKKIAAKYGGKAVFAKVNIDEHPEIAKDIEFLPTFVVFWCGKTLGKIVGGRLLREFDSELSQLLAKKKQIINWNYPPKDMPKEQLERFWGDPDDIPKDFTKRLRRK